MTKKGNRFIALEHLLLLLSDGDPVDKDIGGMMSMVMVMVMMMMLVVMMAVMVLIVMMVTL